MTFNDALGVTLQERAKRRSDAYYRGLDAAIDGTVGAAECEPDSLRESFARGYRDGLAQLAAYPWRSNSRRSRPRKPGDCVVCQMPRGQGDRCFACDDWRAARNAARDNG